MTRKPAGSIPARNRRRTPAVEPLETRTVLSALGDFDLLGATAASPETVVARYDYTGEGPGLETVELSVYRSADAALDLTDVLLGTKTLGVTVGFGQTVEIPLDAPMGIEPSRPYVLISATGDTDPSGNLAGFRKWVVGAVTHGYQPDARFPGWVAETAASLRGQGYDAAIPFNWARPSALPVPGIAELAARNLAFQVNAGAHRLVARGFRPGDVVDVHLIGHSRGGGVVGLAAAALPQDAGPLAGGTQKLTLLDPHPARHVDDVTYYSNSLGPLGTLAARNFVAFQARTADPAAVVPASADVVEVFSQHGAVNDPSPLLGPDERFVNSWGTVPVGLSGPTEVAYYDLTASVPSHTGIYRFYQEVVVPTLGEATPLSQLVPPLNGSGSAEPPDGGGEAPGTGPDYELAILRSFGLSDAVASGLLAEVDRLNGLIDRGDILAARLQLRSLLRAALTLGGPAQADNYLLLLLASTRSLLLSTPA